MDGKDAQGIGFSSLVLRHWVLSIGLPCVVAALAVGGTFLFLKRTHQSTALVTALTLTGDRKPIQLPFDRPGLYLRYFRNDEIVRGLNDRFALDKPPHNLTGQDILDSVLTVEEYRGEMFQGSDAIQVRIKADSPELASSMLEYVVGEGIASFRSALQQRREPILQELKASAAGADAELKKARDERAGFLAAADITELRKRLEAQFDLYSWREDSRQRQVTELSALTREQARLKAILKDEPKTLELRKVLADEPLLQHSLAKRAGVTSSDLAPLELRETQQNPTYVEARSLMIQSLGRQSWLEGHLAALAKQAPAGAELVGKLEDELVGKQEKLKLLDHKYDQALEAAKTARQNLTAFQQMPWPPQRLVALPALVSRKSLGRSRLTVGIAVLFVSFIIVMAVMVCRHRARETR